MDPNTVVVVLALHLFCTGGLLWLIGRHMPPRSGLGRFGVGAMLFGMAYACRLRAGLESQGPFVVLLDATMVLAVLLFLGGLREFVGRRPPPAWLVGFAVLGYFPLGAAVVGAFGSVGRHLLLNAVLGALYLLLARASARAARRQEPALRPPLRVLAFIVGALGALTLARAVSVQVLGLESLFAGWPAQVYYGAASLVAVLLGPMLLWMVFVRLNRELAELATHDALTRLLNRNGLDEALRRHFGARVATSLTLLQIDIDHFKPINDAHGHAAGDAVLRAVARALGGAIRSGDFVARTGGEEFLVGCATRDVEVARALAERLRGHVAALRVPLGDEQLQCTISVGVSAPIDRLDDWREALRQADAALYAAKQAGRNRTTVANADAAVALTTSPAAG